MNYLKKLTTFMLTIVIFITMTACGTKSPTNAVKNELDSIKSGDEKKFSEILKNSNADENGYSSGEEYKKCKEKMAESIKKISYKVNSETIDGDNAKVNVTVNGPDFASLMAKYMQSVFQDALGQTFSGDNLTKEELSEKYNKMLSKLLDDIEYTDRTMDVNLVKENDEWKIKDEDEIMKLISNIDTSKFKNNEVENSFEDEELTTDEELTGEEEFTSNEDLFSNQDNTSEIKEMQLNTPLEVTTDQGSYKITIEGVRTTDKRNEVTDVKAEKVIFLDYTYENISYGAHGNEDLTIGEFNFQVLDDEGYRVDAYPVFDDDKLSKCIPVGGKCKASTAYPITNDTKSISVIFREIDIKIGKIEIEIK